MNTLLPTVIFFGGLLIAVDSICAQSWTQTTANTNYNWVGVASAADGTKLAATTTFNGIWLSTNSGVTWIQNGAPFDEWTGIACSADGTHLIATAYGGGIYISTNSGATWTQTSAPNTSWASVASSADGSKLVAVAATGLYISTNSGTTWAFATNEISGAKSVICSADGTRMAAQSQGCDGDVVYLSTNTGLSWQVSGFSGYGCSFGLASSADGSWLFLSAGESFYASTNWGAAWLTNLIQREGPIACSANGSKLVMAAAGVGIYTSVNFGATWTSNSATNEGWSFIASSADANKLVAVVGGTLPPYARPGGAIWAFQSSSTPQLNLASSSNGMAFSWIVPSSNFVLQQNSDLATTDWVTLTNTPTLNLSNLNNEVVLSPTNRSGFFRLMSQ